MQLTLAIHPPLAAEVHPVRSEWMRQQLAAGNVWLLPSLPASTAAGPQADASRPSFAGAMVLAFSKESRRYTLGVLLSAAESPAAAEQAGPAGSSPAPLASRPVAVASAGEVEQAIIHSAMLLAGSLRPHFLAFIHRAGLPVMQQGEGTQRVPEAYRVAGSSDYITYGSVIAGVPHAQK